MSTNSSIILDIETLDVKPTSLITQIAAIAFNREDLTVIDHIDLRPDFFEQLAAYRTFDPETIAFHRRNGTLPDFCEHRHQPQLPCLEVVTHMGAFFREHRPEKVWIQGTDFDRPIVEDFCQWKAQPLPWKYSISRDARTTYDLAFPGQRHPKRPHKALEDCQATLADLTSALSKLNSLASI